MQEQCNICSTYLQYIPESKWYGGWRCVIAAVQDNVQHAITFLKVKNMYNHIFNIVVNVLLNCVFVYQLAVVLIQTYRITSIKGDFNKTQSFYIY